MMSNPKSTSSLLDDVQGKDISLNRGSSLSADSPERSFLDAISSFKFVECHGFATAIAIYKDSTPSQHLVASDIYERTQYLADTVLSYSHLFTVWKRVVYGKSRSEIKCVDKWLTYRVIIGYTFIDQGKRYSLLDRKDSHLSDAMKDHVLGYTGCGLDDFDKRGERRPTKFKFLERFTEKARAFFKRCKYQKNLLQHIRDYINIVHEDYMKIVKLMDWRLDDLLELRNQPFSDHIPTLPIYFKIIHWELLYNNGEDLDEGGIKKVMEQIKQMQKNPPAKGPSLAKTPTNKTNSSAQRKEPPLPSCISRVFPQTPEMALQLWHGELGNLPPQAMSLYKAPENEGQRKLSATKTITNIKKSAFVEKASHLHEVKDGSDSDVSVGRLPKKRSTSHHMVSAAEEKFISSLHSCISMHLGFHAPCNDDGWCFCPLSKTMNQKWHDAMEFDSSLETKFCSSNKLFRPGSLVSHIEETHKDILGTAVALYLNILYENALGDGIKHYGLHPENSFQYKFSLARAWERDRDFLESFVEKKAIPWQFSFEGVKYTMTCAMDTDLMTLFLLWHRKVLPDKAIRRHPSSLVDILKHIQHGQHALARKLFIDMNFDKSGSFGKSKKGDNPFNCFGPLCAAICNCSFHKFNQNEVLYECSKCKVPKRVQKKVNEFRVGTNTWSSISRPQEKILNEKGYNGKVTIPCTVSQIPPIDGDNDSLVSIQRKGDAPITCSNPRQLEIIVTNTPWILIFVCNRNFGEKNDRTGVDSLSSLQRSVTFGGCHYSLAAVFFGDDSHFCSIAVDPKPEGDLNIFYDGIKRRQRHTCFVPFQGSYKKIVGNGYDISQLWYVKQAHWSWTRADLPKVWDDGDDLDFTYHAAMDDNNCLCQVSPMILRHLDSSTSSWNETVIRSFLSALAQYMTSNKPHKMSDDQTYHLFPFVVTAGEISVDVSRKGKKKKQAKRVQFGVFDADAKNAFAPLKSFIFLLHHNNVIDEEDFPHYVVVKVEKGNDSWMAVITGYDAYGALDPDIWKESVHLIAEHLGVKNRSNVVFNVKSTRTPTPSPSKIFASKTVMADDGDNDDNVSCGPYCCSFLLDFYMKRERIDHKMVPDVTSDSLRRRTKSRMIFVLLKLIKPGAEASMTYGDSNNKVNIISCEVDQHSYEKGPEKYSARNLNLSLLSLPVETISNLLLSSGCPCERTQFSGAPYIQCSSCYKVYHVECFFAYVKYLNGDKIQCQGCNKEVGRDVDMLLLPPMRQLTGYEDYINDGVLVLDFLKCGDMSKERRKDIRESRVNSLAKRYGKCWAFVSPYPNRLDESSVPGESAGTGVVASADNETIKKPQTKDALKPSPSDDANDPDVKSEELPMKEVAKSFANTPSTKSPADTGKDNDTNEDSGSDVEDIKKDSVTIPTQQTVPPLFNATEGIGGESALSLSISEPPDEALETQAKEVSHVDKAKSPANTGPPLFNATEGIVGESALSLSTFEPPEEALVTQAKEVSKTSNSIEAMDSHVDKAKSPADTGKDNETNEDSGRDVEDIKQDSVTINDNRSSRLRTPPLFRQSMRNLNRKAVASFVKSELVRVMQHHNAIGTTEKKVQDIGVWYPQEYCGLQRCHYRSLYCVDPDLAKIALEDNLRHDEYEKLQELVANNDGGDIFRVRQQDWVTPTNTYFIADKICYEVIDHPLAKFILKYSEFDLPYDTMVVPKDLEEDLETQAKAVKELSIDDVEDGRTDSVTNEVVLSSSTLDGPEDSVDVGGEAVTKLNAKNDARNDETVKFPSTLGPPADTVEADGQAVTKLTVNEKSFVGKRVLVRCDYNPNYFLNGRVSSVDADNGIYTVEFDEKDDAAPHFYTADELKKILFKPVVGIGGVSFVPYPGMSVFAFRMCKEEKAEIKHAFKNDAKLKWAKDNSLSMFCVPYNLMRPVNDDDVADKITVDPKSPLKKCNTGVMFAPYVGCAVMVVYPAMNHPAKVLSINRTNAEVKYDVGGTVERVPYDRMIPVLDIDIPRAKRRKHDQFRYIPNFDNSEQKYLCDELKHKQPPRGRSTILDSLSKAGRYALKCRHAPFTHRQPVKPMNEDVITDDFLAYHDEWLRMRGARRGHVTTTSGNDTCTSPLGDLPSINLPSTHRVFQTGSLWTNFNRITTVMEKFASSCIPKTNFPGVDICLFDLCTSLDFGVHMDIRLANAAQASMVFIFVPNSNECPVTQQFISKLYVKQILKDEEQEAEQRRKEEERLQKEAERREREEAVSNGRPLPKRKKKNTPQSQQKRKKLGKNDNDAGADDFDIPSHKHLLLLVHAPTECKPEDIITSFQLGFFEFQQKFEAVCSLSFSPPNVHPNECPEKIFQFEVFGKGRFNDDRYRDCGSLKTFVTALAQGFLCKSHPGSPDFIDEGGLVVVPENKTTKSYILEFLDSRSVSKEPLVRASHLVARGSPSSSIDVRRIFGTPTIVKKCSISDAKGNICASLREILRNSYECLIQCCEEGRDIQPFHYNSLEFACNSDMCIYVDSKNDKFKIGCLVCNKCALGGDVDGYGTMKEALANTVTKVGIVHRIASSAFSWLERGNNEEEQPIGQTPYRLHRCHLSEGNVSGVIPCLPDRTKLDSCLGMDQVIVSAIENEKLNDESPVYDIAACWVDVCEKIFLDEAVTEHIHEFELNFLHTVVHGLASAKTKFLHRMRQRDLILMDTGTEWKGDDKLQETHLINHAKQMMKIDWKHGSFPRTIPGDSELSESDMVVLNEALAAKTDGMEFLHQTGILSHYLRHAPEDSICALKYRELPRVSHRYAFERGNLCKDIFTQAGKQDRLHSSEVFVVRSHINNWNNETQVFVMSIADDESFDVTALTKKETNETIGVEIDWILSDELENLIHDTAHQNEINNMIHGEWRGLSKKLKTTMCQYSKGSVTSYQPISFDVKSLHPYQASVNSYNMRSSDNRLGFARMQVALGNSFYYGSIHHQRALEKMINSSFQKPIIHRRETAKRTHLAKSIPSTVKVVWGDGCAIPKVGCPPGINDLMALPHRVETVQWNCFRSNVQNLLAVLGQSNDQIEEELSTMTLRAEERCLRGNPIRELCRVFKAVGYHTFILPCDMDDDLLEYCAHLMKLPMFVSMKMSFNKDVTQYSHIVGLCPYFSPGSVELKISIVEGAHPQLQAMQFTKDNMTWCCGEEAETKFNAFAFFPGKKLTKRFLRRHVQDLNNGLKFAVCLGKNVKVPKEYSELCLQNMVMGDVQHYQKLLPR